MTIAGGSVLLLGAAGFALMNSGAFDGTVEDDGQGTVFASEADEVETGPDLEQEAAESGLLKMGIVLRDTDNPDRQFDGEIMIGAGHIRSFVGKPGDHVNPRGIASETMDARNFDGQTAQGNANENFEVLYDFAANKRYAINHIGREMQEDQLVVSPSNPFGTIMAQAPGPVSDREREALRKLTAAMSKTRLDPKREIKLVGSTGEGKTVIINGTPVSCSWHRIDRMGGKMGEACLAPNSEVPFADKYRALLGNMPLAGAGKNDLPAYFRQLVELNTSSLTVAIRFGSESDDTGEYSSDWEAEVSGFERRDTLDPELFEPPAGYRLRTMGGFFQ